MALRNLLPTLAVATSAALGIALPGAAAAEETPLLPGEAFATPAACTVDPFSGPRLDQHERSLQRGCGRDVLDVRVDAPRPRASDAAPAPAPVRVEVDQVLTRQVLHAVTASARLGWQAASDDGFSRLEHGRTLVAAGGRVRLREGWAVDLNAGGELADALRTRATMTGLWRPAHDHLVFAEVAAEDGSVENVVGYRWWIAPRRAVIDVSARRSADGRTFEPRLGFQLHGFAQ